MQKVPVYYVSFGAVGSGSYVPSIPTEFATGRIMAATKIRKTIMSVPMGGGQSISELAGSSTISSMSFNLLDTDGEITKMINTYPMKNRVVTLYAGYDDVPEPEFIILFRGVLNNISTTQDGTAWSFTVADFQRLTKTAKFTASTVTLSSIDENALTVTIPASPTSSFPWFAPQTIQGNRGPVNFMKIDDEIIGYRSIVTSITGDYNTVNIYGRGLMGTTKNKHDAGASVTNAILLDGNPLDIMLWLMTSKTGDGTNGTYDVLPAGQGVGIDVDFVLVDDIERQRDRFISGTRFQFLITESTDIKSFIETEILKVLNGYPVVKNDGRLTVKLYTPPFPVDVVAAFDETNIIAAPSFDMRLQSNSGFINVIDFKYDHDANAGEFYSQKIIVDGDSVTESEENAVFKVESKGLRGGFVFQGETIVQRFANMVFQRYSKGCPGISVQTFYSKHLCEMGDSVTIKSAYVPNSFQRLMNGDPIICEVVNKAIDYQSGRLTFNLKAAGFNFNDRWFIISPSDQVGYDTATDAEKASFGFISSELSPTVGIMGDTGDPGYKITP